MKLELLLILAMLALAFYYLGRPAYMISTYASLSWSEDGFSISGSDSGVWGCTCPEEECYAEFTVDLNNYGFRIDLSEEECKALEGTCSYRSGVCYKCFIPGTSMMKYFEPVSGGATVTGWSGERVTRNWNYNQLQYSGGSNWFKVLVPLGVTSCGETVSASMSVTFKEKTSTTTTTTMPTTTTTTIPSTQPEPTNLLDLIILKIKLFFVWLKGLILI
jgi:hypothetical protein